MVGVLTGSLLTLILLGMPVAFALAFVGAFGLWIAFGSDMGLAHVPGVFYKSLDDFVVTAIPLYVLMSQILLVGRVGNDFFELASKWVRHLPGGLGIATVISCAVFAAISGASVTTALTIGLVAIPEMIQRGYDKKLVFGLLAAGGSLGILIPPSIPMLLFGSITNESVGKLFMAGVIPGILLSFVFMVYVVFKCRKDETITRFAPATWAERIEATRRSMWGLLIPIIVIGGIYTGIFTPTESAAVGVVVSLLVCFFINKTLKLTQMKKVLLDSLNTSCMVLGVMVGANLFAQLLTLQQIPQTVTSFITGVDVSPFMIVILIMVLYFILGMFLDVTSIVLITVPIIYPVIIQLGIDPIWFAILMVINMEIAVITPPVGLNLFAIQGISKEPLITVIQGVIPFIFLTIAFMLLLAFIPEIATWLPSLMDK